MSTYFFICKTIALKLIAGTNYMRECTYLGTTKPKNYVVYVKNIYKNKEINSGLQRRETLDDINTRNW